MVNAYRQWPISVTEAAKELQCHVSTVHRWIHPGVRGRRLPSVMVGGRRYIRRDDLEAFIGVSATTADETASQRDQAAQQQLAAFGLRPSPQSRKK